MWCEDCACVQELQDWKREKNQPVCVLGSDVSGKPLNGHFDGGNSRTNVPAMALAGLLKCRKDVSLF